MQKVPFSRQAVEYLSKVLREPEWMLKLRLDAFELYESLPMPTTSDEAWRRTNLRRLKLDDIGPSIRGGGVDHDVPEYLREPLPDTETLGNMLIMDGVTNKYTADPELEKQGVVFCNMSLAVREHEDLVKEYFMTKGVPIKDGKFAALHAAFWRGGTFVYVPKGVTVKAPLRSANWLSYGKTYHHTLVIVEEGADVTLLEEFLSANKEEQELHNGVVELFVNDGGRLTYASMQDFGHNVWQISHERARVGRDAQLNWVTSIMGTRLTKAFQTVELDGRGSTARVSGLFFGHGRQHFDLDTQQNHNAPDTTSDLLYKGALKDKSRSVWQGLIKALPGAQRIDGFQANRNLLLDKAARADSIPGLEIEADDVRCTHAATMGQIDQDEIFYMMSRGIPESEALRMAVEGFFAPVIERIPVEFVRDRIAQNILDKVG